MFMFMKYLFEYFIEKWFSLSFILYIIMKLDDVDIYW